MKRISTSVVTFFALALAASACSADAQPEDDESVDQTSDLTEAEREAAQAREHTSANSTSGAVTHSAELSTGSGCATCGPLPDPWKKTAGPLPDPWKSTSSGGGTGGGGTGTGTGTGSSGH